MNVFNQSIGECDSSKQLQTSSPMDNLKRRKLSLESQLENVNAVIKTLEENPNVYKVLELMAKV